MERVAVIDPGWIPTQRANALALVRLCEAFAVLDRRVTLYYVPATRSKDDIFRHYGVKTPFELRPLPRMVLPFRKSFRPDTWRELPALVHALAWSRLVAHLVRRQGADFCLTKVELLAWSLATSGLRTIPEIHKLPTPVERAFITRAARRGNVPWIIAITEHLRSDLIREFGMPPEKMVTLRSGVDLGAFRDAASRQEARRQTGLPLDRTLVVYTGQLYESVGTFVEALPGLEGVHGLVVGGGSEDETQRLEKKAREVGAKNLTLVGHVEPFRIPLYLMAADVLVLPYSGKSTHLRYHMSPLKLFEYMAAGRPIVASRLPSVEEVLRDGENAVLYSPDDPLDLAAAVRRALANGSEQMSAAARRDVQPYSWLNRANAILGLMNGTRKLDASLLTGERVGVRP